LCGYFYADFSTNTSPKPPQSVKLVCFAVQREHAR